MSIREERKLQSRQALLDTALLLSTSGRSFNSISLREITRHIGLVPTAFYRHFEKMDALALELVDQVSLHLKRIMHQIGQTYLYLPDAKTKNCLDLFFNAVDKNPELWIFLIAERWGGSEILRQSIARELDFLIEDFANDLHKIPGIQHIENQQDLNVLAQILINLSFNWAMTWIGYKRQFKGNILEQQQLAFKEQTIIQINLLFRGISNWNPPQQDENNML
ncbi:MULTISPECIES: TetR family transcriptional regulator [unclassified Acinetobacter]|uniref:TetR family transcriptional regulator n=1 Tax=unclassified Acinetobacter TaxID=196816 RepID=UPI0029352653|nr:MULTISPECIES: TetR family transcriptional regulator [unclassified Acinetobacter]WOE30804.1 TetR family transcriptional regulator [Acinetobacter sp. SAAs470]WOE38998.1 TetR family transcriptional regulator [Acinetobacter sp. SAAs474]